MVCGPAPSIVTPLCFGVSARARSRWIRPAGSLISFSPASIRFSRISRLAFEASRLSSSTTIRPSASGDRAGRAAATVNQLTTPIIVSLIIDLAPRRRPSDPLQAAWPHLTGPAFRLFHTHPHALSRIETDTVQNLGIRNQKDAKERKSKGKETVLQ